MIDLPIPYDWFVLLTRLAVASLLLLFLWQLLRALVRDAIVVREPVDLQLSPANGGRPIPLRRVRPIVLGRDDEADVVVPDPSVSGRHARLEWAGGGWLLTDLASTNGTFLNGDRTSAPIPIYTGDVVHFGRFCVHVTAAGADDHPIGVDRAGNR